MQMRSVTTEEQVTHWVIDPLSDLTRTKMTHDPLQVALGLTTLPYLTYLTCGLDVWGKQIPPADRGHSVLPDKHSPILALSTKLTFSPCVVLVVAFCYLGHSKNW